MLKPRRRRRPFEAAKHTAPLPRERWAAQPFVYCDGRIVAPWPSHYAATPEDHERLACCVDFVRAAPPDQPCWIWPERAKPEPLKCDGPVRDWLTRWAQGRTSYVARPG